MRLRHTTYPFSLYLCMELKLENVIIEVLYTFENVIIVVLYMLENVIYPPKLSNNRSCNNKFVA